MKLLVNAPTGKQEVIEVGEGGSYFDESRVIWDERVDGTLPEITLGGMERGVFMEAPCLNFNQVLLDSHIAASAPPVPQAVTRRQARQALLLAGLLPSIQPAIDLIENPIQRGIIQIEWEDSQTFERQRPALLLLASALGMTSAELDQLFITASAL